MKTYQIVVKGIASNRIYLRETENYETFKYYLVIFGDKEVYNIITTNIY